MMRCVSMMFKANNKLLLVLISDNSLKTDDKWENARFLLGVYQSHFGLRILR